MIIKNCQEHLEKISFKMIANKCFSSQLKYKIDEYMHILFKNVKNELCVLRNTRCTRFYKINWYFFILWSNPMFIFCRNENQFKTQILIFKTDNGSGKTINA